MTSIIGFCFLLLVGFSLANGSSFIIRKPNIVQCSRSSCGIKILDQKPKAIAYLSSNRAVFFKQGTIVAICYRSETIGGISKLYWEINAFRYLGNRVISLTQNQHSTLASLYSKLEVRHDNSNSRIKVECCTMLPINKNQGMKLRRTLPNSLEMPLEYSIDDIKVNLVQDDAGRMFMNMSLTQDVVYGPPYQNNQFKCVAFDRVSNLSWSVSSKSLQYEREMDKNLIIVLGKKDEILSLNETLVLNKDIVKGVSLTCKDDMGVPKPTFQWRRWTSNGLHSRVYSDRVMIQLEGNTRYCCHATQRLERRIIYREQCVNLKKQSFRDCAAIKKDNPSAESGVYNIYPNSRVGSQAMRVYCDMKTNDQQWIVIQRRKNGLVTFDKHWNQYKQGFGELKNEFWLGNDNINRLTSQGQMKIRFDLWDNNNNYGYAEYNTFAIENESNLYKLQIAGYAGNASDCMIYCHNLNGSPFSTRDRDNDLSSKSCSRTSGGNGGWWFRSCFRAHLNGHYFTPGTVNQQGIVWYYWKSSYLSLKHTEMKIKYIH